jgi:hypothetical protein
MRTAAAGEARQEAEAIVIHNPGGAGVLSRYLHRRDYNAMMRGIE